MLPAPGRNTSESGGEEADTNGDSRWTWCWRRGRDHTFLPKPLIPTRASLGRHTSWRGGAHVNRPLMSVSTTWPRHQGTVYVRPTSPGCVPAEACTGGYEWFRQKGMGSTASPAPRTPRPAIRVGFLPTRLACASAGGRKHCTLSSRAAGPFGWSEESAIPHDLRVGPPS